MSPLVSVILATYDRPQFLQEAAGSILIQTLENLEVIIVDDGSKTPETAEIASKIAAQDSRVRYVRKENGGLASARNFGAKEARGEFICFMDDDDISHPRRIQTQAKFLQDHLEIVATSCDISTFRHSNEIRTDTPTSSSPPVTQDKNPLFESAPARLSTFVMGTTMMIRRTAFLDFRGYDENFLVMEDLDFTLRIEEMHAVAKIPEPLLWYRVHDSGNLLKHPQAWQHTCAAYVNAMFRRRGSPPPDCSISELTRYASQLPPSLKRFLMRDASKSAKRLLRAKNYAALNELLQDFNRAFNGRRAMPVYFRIFLWSLWFGKLPAFVIAARRALVDN